jgi:glutamine phosphoribosylpyrophosphate amidotransferase
VREAFRTRDMRALLGTIGLGHVRYATKGTASSEEEAQPFYVNAPYGIVLVHNGNLTNTRELTDELFRKDRRHLNTSSDTELLVNVLANELQASIGGLELDPAQVFQAVSRVTSASRDRTRRSRSSRVRTARVPRPVRHPAPHPRHSPGRGRPLRVDRGL